jgi:hypothetical protein
VRLQLARAGRVGRGAQQQCAQQQAPGGALRPEQPDGGRALGTGRAQPVHSTRTRRPPARQPATRPPHLATCRVPRVPAPPIGPDGSRALDIRSRTTTPYTSMSAPTPAGPCSLCTTSTHPGPSTSRPRTAGTCRGRRTPR